MTLSVLVIEPYLPNCVSTPSHSLAASSAVPDANHRALHAVLAAECAHVPGVLGDLDLLDHLSQTRTITSTVLSYNSGLLCTLRLLK